MEFEEIAVDIRIITIVHKNSRPADSGCSTNSGSMRTLPPRKCQGHARHYQILTGLLNDHEGERTEEAIEFYGRLAEMHYRRQIAFEAVLASLRRKNRPDSGSI